MLALLERDERQRRAASKTATRGRPVVRHTVKVAVNEGEQDSSRYDNQSGCDCFGKGHYRTRSEILGRLSEFGCSLPLDVERHPSVKPLP